MRNFTKYPSSYVKASASRDSIETAILDAISDADDTNKYRLSSKTFTNLAYYMSGYMSNVSLRDFIDAYENLKDRGLINLP